MTCKIVRLAESDHLVLLHISGHLQDVHIKMIDDLLTKETDPVALDLGEVTLVDRDAVSFLATLDAKGIGLRNCPAFIRAWMRKL
jgi:hypothetical protein